MQRDPVLARFDDGKPKGKRLLFTVHGGVHYIRGNSAPYFSITAAGYDCGSEFGGCCHEIILKHFPKFADLVALHLSGIDGMPMHADSNGWYDLAGYFGGAGERYHVGNRERHFPIEPPADKPWQNTEYRKPTREECLQIWAEHMRIDLQTAKDAAEAIAAKWNWPDMKAAHAAFVEMQRPRWRQEAADCIKRHGLVVYGDE